MPVVINVHHGRAGGPSVRPHARRLRDVFEPHVAFVQVQAARDHVAGKENVRQAVVIDITDRHARTVVYVDVGLNIHRVIGGDGVCERDAGLRRGEEVEQWPMRSFRAAAIQQQ